jgi:hypothetical protein
MIVSNASGNAANVLRTGCDSFLIDFFSLEDAKIRYFLAISEAG